MSARNVVVVGAGPVGLITALGLVRAGVDVTLLEAEQGAASTPQDMVYSWTLLPGLQRLGVLQDLLRVGFTESRLCFRVLRTGEWIVADLTALNEEVEHPYNLLVRPADLAEVVTARLATSPGARVEWGTRVTDVTQDDHGVTVIAQGPEGERLFRAGWVVGADGAHSRVRRSLGLGFLGTTWEQRFVATDVRFDFSTLGFSRLSYQIDPTYGALLAHAHTDPLWRYVYAESRLLAEETIPERMSAVFEKVLPAGCEPQVERWSAYRVHERAAERLRVGRVLLAGDAAHVTNPTASLGLAGGLFDSYSLTEGLAAVVHGDAGDDVLDRYADVRRRAFVTSASPLSSDRMHLVFDSGGPDGLETDLSSFREISTDPYRLRELLMQGKELESPSLLSSIPAGG